MLPHKWIVPVGGGETGAPLNIDDGTFSTLASAAGFLRSTNEEN